MLRKDSGMNITVYCGASIGSKEIYSDKTRELAMWIADKSHRLIYGGGNVGLMGLIADTVMAEGAEVIGIMPGFLAEREIAHKSITELRIVNDMTERKKLLIELGEAFIALPGGPGTLEEISEVISWARIGQNNAPCIVYNIDGYYDELRNMYDNMVENAFLTRSDREKILFSDKLEEIEEFILNYQPPSIRKY